MTRLGTKRLSRTWSCPNTWTLQIGYPKPKMMAKEPI